MGKLTAQGKEDRVNYQIKTDSEGVVKLLNDRYMTYSDEKLQSMTNGDLVVPLIEKFVRVKQYYEVNKDKFSNGGKFTIDWVKGHAGEEGNEIADELQDVELRRTKRTFSTMHKMPLFAYASCI